MKKVLKGYLVLTFLVVTTIFSYGQVDFDIDFAEPSGYSWGGALLEMEDGGYLCSGVRDSLLLLMKLDADGGIIDSIYYGNKTTLYYKDELFETDSSFLVIGTTINEQDTFPSFWMGEFSKDLEFQKEYLLPFPWNKGIRYIHYTWELGQDTVLFATGYKAGWINLATDELYYQNSDSLYFYEEWTNILARRDSAGYLISGWGIKYTDDHFKRIKINPFWQATLGDYYAGVNIKYINDTTFFLATSFECALSREFVKKGDGGIFVGVMDKEFNLLYHDTLSIEHDETSVRYYNSRLKILAQSPDSTFIVGGMTDPYHDYNNRIYCAKYNEKAERIWGGVLYTDEEYHHYYFLSVLATQDGGAILSGGRRLGFGHKYQFYLIKIGPDGLVTGETTIPMGKSPIKVYPNPTSDIIRFDMQDKALDLDFELMDMQGRTVLRQKVTGDEEISTHHLPQGIYAYRLLNKKGEMMYSGKMVKE